MCCGVEGIRFVQSFVVSVLSNILCHFGFFLLAIVLSVRLRFTASGICIFNRFLVLNINYAIPIYVL